MDGFCIWNYSPWWSRKDLTPLFAIISLVDGVFSISPELSVYYWQWRWWWNLTEIISSMDRFCILNYSPWWSRQHIRPLFAIISLVDGVFSISPELSVYYWQWRWWWNLQEVISSMDRFCIWNYSAWWSRKDLTPLFATISFVDGVFSISAELSVYYWQWRW